MKKSKIRDLFNIGLKKENIISSDKDLPFLEPASADEDLPFLEPVFPDENVIEVPADRFAKVEGLDDFPTTKKVHTKNFSVSSIKKNSDWKDATSELTEPQSQKTSNREYVPKDDITLEGHIEIERNMLLQKRKHLDDLIKIKDNPEGIAQFIDEQIKLYQEVILPASEEYRKSHEDNNLDMTLRIMCSNQEKHLANLINIQSNPEGMNKYLNEEIKFCQSVVIPSAEKRLKDLEQKLKSNETEME